MELELFSAAARWIDRSAEVGALAIAWGAGVGGARRMPREGAMAPLRIEVVSRAQAAALAAMSVAQRVEIAGSAHRFARAALRRRVAEVLPLATESERQREYLRRLLGRGADGFLAARG